MSGTSRRDVSLEHHSGDYALDGHGQLASTGIETALTHLLTIHAAKWAGNPGIGSDLHTLRKRILQTPAVLEDMVRRALRPAIEDGRVRDLRITATTDDQGRTALDITVTDNGGQDLSLAQILERVLGAA